MEELMLHLKNARTLVYVSLAAIVLTFATHLIFAKYRFVKYIPGFILIIIGLYNIYKASSDFTSPDSLNPILIFLICFLGGIIGLFSGLIIGIYNKPKRVRKKNKASKGHFI